MSKRFRMAQKPAPGEPPHNFGTAERPKMTENINQSASFAFIYNEWLGNKTSTQSFLKQLNDNMPWEELQKICEPYYSNNPPLEVMLRICLLQEMYSLSDIGIHEELIKNNNRAFVDFCDLNKIPSTDDIGAFRCMLDQNNIRGKLYALAAEKLQQGKLLPVPLSYWNVRQVLWNIWQTLCTDEKEKLWALLPPLQRELLEGMNDEYEKILQFLLIRLDEDFPEVLERVYDRFPDHRRLCEPFIEQYKQKDKKDSKYYRNVTVTNEEDNAKRELSRKEDAEKLKTDAEDRNEIKAIINFFSSPEKVTRNYLYEFINISQSAWYAALDKSFRGGQPMKNTAVKTSIALGMSPYEAEYFLARTWHGGLDEGTRGHNCIRRCLREKELDRKKIDNRLKINGFKPLFNVDGSFSENKESRLLDI